MKKAPLYSRSRSPAARAAAPPDSAPRPPAGSPSGGPAGTSPAAAGIAPGADASSSSAALASTDLRYRRWTSAGLIAIAALLTAVLLQGRTPPAPVITAEAIDAAVRQSLTEKPLPSKASRAYDVVRPSVVRVLGLMDDKDEGNAVPLMEPGQEPPAGRGIGLGTGVVIMENGTILTNLHVVQGARRIRVTFADGHESEARLMSTDPGNDLAVLRAVSIPDDLQPATMRSTGDLMPGDEVVAAGFPFGIGPSVSAGVVSGLKRAFRSPDGQQVMSNLIQFDAAANPGNSGGPLITMEGEVVGIVTAILNPSKQRVFVGIGFAVPIENAAAAAGMPPF